MDKQQILEKTRKELEVCKKNAIESIEKEEMVPATNYLLTMRDLKTQELLIKYQIKQEEKN